jgi:hypothetical protein
MLTPARLSRAGCLLLVLVTALASACSHKPAAPVAVPVISDPGPQIPCEVELFDAKATLTEPKIVRFEVKYRFTKGKPDKFYACTISFPGTPNLGRRTMQNWQLQAEGVIKDGVALSQPGVKTFEIVMGEAPSGQDSYSKISNVVRGPVE